MFDSVKNNCLLARGGSTVVELLPDLPKVKGLSPAATSGLRLLHQNCKIAPLSVYPIVLW